jgi:hypothetical protein
MYENLTQEEKYQLGLSIGEAIGNLFKLMAEIDGIPVETAVDHWVESYIADKIIEATEENNGEP